MCVCACVCVFNTLTCIGAFSLRLYVGAAYNRCQVATSRAVPPGTDYIYVCPNVNGTVFLQMLVTVPGNAPTSPPNPLLASQGVIGDPSHKDTIQFRANVSNNNTIVNCTYLNSTSQRIVCGNSVMLSIYGISKDVHFISGRFNISDPL